MEKKKRNDTGFKWTTKPVDGTRFNGNSSPIWINPYKKFYLAMSLWHLINSVTTLCVYIFVLENYNDCDLPMKPISVSLLSLGFVEFMVFFGYSRTNYATDVEWSKILGVTFLFFVLTLLLTLTNALMVRIILPFSYPMLKMLRGALVLMLPNFPQVCPTTSAWEYTVWQATVAIVGAYFLLSTSKIILLILYVVHFYFRNNASKFYYKNTREIMILD